MRLLSIILLALVACFFLACSYHAKETHTYEAEGKIELPPPPKISVSFEAKAEYEVKGGTGVYYVPNEANEDIYYEGNAKFYWRSHGNAWFKATKPDAPPSEWVRADPPPTVATAKKEEQRPAKYPPKRVGGSKSKKK